MTRKAIPVKVQVSVAFLQATFGGRGVLCPLCVNPIGFAEARVLEHMIPHATCVAIGKDPDDFENLRFVHKACADRKTNGTKATCAGGDVHKIAKAKRLATARAAHQAVVKHEADKVRGSIKSGRKIQSRPFQKKEKANV